MKSIRERYLTDATFHAIVDSMRAIISGAHLTPSEVREAAMLACIIEDERRPFGAGFSCTCLSISRDPLCVFHGDKKL
jgi:hypothetical protein